MYKTT